MINRILGGPAGLLIGVAAAISLAFGVLTYLVQSSDNGNSRASVELRLHDEVVSWPNHSALQREAVATVNDEAGQAQLRSAAGSDLISIEASTLGDPASVQIEAVASNDDSALRAAVIAADLAIAESVLDRAAPIESQLSALRADLATAVSERDDMLSRLSEGIDDDAERAIVGASVESVAGVASVLEQDVARLEADLNAKTAPLVQIGEAQLVTQGQNALNSALAAALGAFFVSVLGLSLIRNQPPSTIPRRSIDLTGEDGSASGVVPSTGESERLPASVE